jgi:hypothetical protein
MADPSYYLVITLIVGAIIVIPIAISASNSAARAKRAAERLAYLRAKYKDEVIVQRIINRECWRGETAEQLIDSLGRPADIDHKLLKTKSKEVWKYGHRGANRYAVRVTLENNVVIGWDVK